MASLECWKCNKMLGYDKKDDVLIVPSSSYVEDEGNVLELDIKCPRCKKHNIIIFAE